MYYPSCVTVKYLYQYLYIRVFSPTDQDCLRWLLVLLLWSTLYSTVYVYLWTLYYLATKASSVTFSKLKTLVASVTDSWRLDTDPDPRIRTTGFRLRIRVMLFSSVTSNHDGKKQAFSHRFFLHNTYWRYIYVSLQW
jgi:hypothetical protein